MNELIEHIPLCLLSCLIVHIVSHKVEELIRNKYKP
jgi:MFS superfamily sulfate permease-like transporter